MVSLATSGSSSIETPDSSLATGLRSQVRAIWLAVSPGTLTSQTGCSVSMHLV